MNKYAVGFLCIVLPGCMWFLTPAKTVVGSGKSVKRPLMYMWRDKKPFDTLSVSGIGTVFLTQGDSESIAIEADDNLHEYIKVNMDDNELEIGIEEGVQLRPKTPINYYITFKKINEIELSGAVQLKTPLIQTKKLELELKGSSRADATIKAEKLEVEMAGAAKVNVDGAVEKQKLEIVGAAIYNGGKLQSDSCKIEVSGSARITVQVKDKLEVDASGVAVVAYHGDPEVKVDKSGAVTVNKVG